MEHNFNHDYRFTETPTFSTVRFSNSRQRHTLEGDDSWPILFQTVIHSMHVRKRDVQAFTPDG